MSLNGDDNQDDECDRHAVNYVFSRLDGSVNGKSTNASASTSPRDDHNCMLGTLVNGLRWWNWPFSDNLSSRSRDKQQVDRHGMAWTERTLLSISDSVHS